MQRIQAVTHPEGKAKTLLANVRQAMGTTPKIFTTFANAPAALEAYLNFNAALSGDTLDPKLREQLAVTVACFNGCDYCALAHTFLGSKPRVNQAELQANIAGHSSDCKTQVAFSFARALMDTRGGISDEETQAVREAGYSDGEIIEILAHVALNTFTKVTGNK